MTQDSQVLPSKKDRWPLVAVSVGFVSAVLLAALIYNPTSPWIRLVVVFVAIFAVITGVVLWFNPKTRYRRWTSGLLGAASILAALPSFFVNVEGVGQVVVDSSPWVVFVFLVAACFFALLDFLQSNPERQQLSSAKRTKSVTITNNELNESPQSAIQGGSYNRQEIHHHYYGATHTSEPMPKPSKEGSEGIFEVPEQSSRHFVGRDKLLKDIEEELSSDVGSVALTQQIIHGLGGVGKSRAAIEYAHQQWGQGTYDIVFWLEAETRESLAQDLAALWVKMSGRSGLTIIEQAESALRALEQKKRWLLIYDNAADLASIKPFLPRTGRGHVLITSRSHEWGEIARPLRVSTLSREASIKLLMSRRDAKSEEGADEVAELVGDLPLALMQAAAHVESLGESFSWYAKAFRKKRQAILKSDAPTDYPETVATTWSLNFEQLEKRSPHAVALMKWCAFLDPDGVDIEWLRGSMSHLPEDVQAAISEENYPYTQRELLRCSFAEARLGKLAFHRLTLAVMRDRLDEEQAASSCNRVFEWLKHVFDFKWNDVESFASSRLSAIHASIFAELPITERLCPEQASALLHQVGTFLHRVGDLKGARSYLEKSLEIDIRVHGTEEHPDVATSMHELAGVLKAQGDLKGARSYLEKSLEIQAKVHGTEEHPDIAASMHELAGVLKAQGDLKGARSYLEKSLEIKDKVHGTEEHPDVATSMHSLAGVLLAQGDLKGARSYLERVLDIELKVYGSRDHYSSAQTEMALAGIDIREGRSDEARERLRHAHEVFLHQLGPEHEDTKLAESLLNWFG